MLIYEAIVRLDAQIVEPRKQVVVKIVKEEIRIGEDGISEA